MLTRWNRSSQSSRPWTSSTAGPSGSCGATTTASRSTPAIPSRSCGRLPRPRRRSSTWWRSAPRATAERRSSSRTLSVGPRRRCRCSSAAACASVADARRARARQVSRASSSAPPRSGEIPLREFVAALGERLVVAIDVAGGIVRTAGWLESSELTTRGGARALHRGRRAPRRLHRDRPRRHPRRPRPRPAARGRGRSSAARSSQQAASATRRTSTPCAGSASTASSSAARGSTERSRSSSASCCAAVCPAASRYRESHASPRSSTEPNPTAVAHGRRLGRDACGRRGVRPCVRGEGREAVPDPVLVDGADPALCEAGAGVPRTIQRPGDRQPARLCLRQAQARPDRRLQGPCGGLGMRCRRRRHHLRQTADRASRRPGDGA